jgi:hypothetical protein
MNAFGHEFTYLDESHVNDLMSLEREKAIYSDHWIDGLDDFRHVRIALTDEEIAEYVRSMIAFDRFLGSDAEWARDVPGIPADIAERADSYMGHTRDGESFGPPWHCAAGFMGEHLETVTCFDRSRVQVIEEQGVAAFLSAVRRAVDALTPAIRCFSNREKGLAPWAVSREDDVRDLLFAMLRGAIADIKREEPIPSKAGRAKVVDLFSRVARTLIEVKWVKSKVSWNGVLEDIFVDIQTYGRHPECANIVFVIVDAARVVPDPRLVEEQLAGTQAIDGKTVSVTVYIREP